MILHSPIQFAQSSSAKTQDKTSIAACCRHSRAGEAEPGGSALILAVQGYGMGAFGLLGSQLAPRREQDR